MINVTTSISLSSTILTHYEAIYHYHLHNGVFVSELIRYARASFTHDQFLKRGKLLTSKLKKHFRSFYGHTTTLSAILSYQQVQSPFGRMLADVYQFYCQAIVSLRIVKFSRLLPTIGLSIRTNKNDTGTILSLLLYTMY